MGGGGTLNLKYYFTFSDKSNRRRVFTSSLWAGAELFNTLKTEMGRMFLKLFLLLLLTLLLRLCVCMCVCEE